MTPEAVVRLAEAAYEKYGFNDFKPPLLTVAKQRSNVHAQMLAQQIQQRRFNPGHHVNGSAQIEGLQAAAAGITPGTRALAKSPAAKRSARPWKTPRRWWWVKRWASTKMC
jgi:hypothetical protein